MALLQQETWLPTWHGSSKCNRLLLEELVRAGHTCLALSSIHRQESTRGDFLQDMALRQIDVHELGHGEYSYRQRGVRVSGLAVGGCREQRDALYRKQLDAFGPDVIVVSAARDDSLLQLAHAAAPGRVVFLVHNLSHLPFGPLAEREDANAAARLGQAGAIIAVSHHSQEYIERYGGLAARRMSFPVYGSGPFPNLGSRDGEHVTLIKSAVSKGVDTFLELARCFPDQTFAAVRWGAGPATLAHMESLPNVRILDPVDDIEDILRQTKILLMPSRSPETFGLAAPEAMLRGIPVVASCAGGLQEAMLGMDYLLPVPSDTGDEKSVTSWRDVLYRLLTDSAEYERISQAARAAATRFVAPLSIEPFEDLFREIGCPSVVSRADSIIVPAVIDPFDAGYLLVQEFRRRGCGVIGVVSSEDIDPEITGKSEPESFRQCILHGGDVRETSGQLRRACVGAVLAGCETGVMLADSLSESLGLVSNGTQLSEARRDKFRMAEALRQAGLAVPRQICSANPDTLAAWASQLDDWPVISKPASSLGSDGVRLCRSSDELQAAFREVAGCRNMSGLVNDGLLVQEYIDASQFVVDTVTSDGQHSLCAIWRYIRPAFAGALSRWLRGEAELPPEVGELSDDMLSYAVLSSSAKEVLPGSGRLAETLFDFAKSALDALGIRHGPAHLEIMLSDRGPLLIDAGARVHGAPQTHAMARMCTGVSQVEKTVDVCLSPGAFPRFVRQSYELRFHGMMLRLKPWQRGVLQAVCGLDRIEKLPSYHAVFQLASPGRIVPSCVGVVWLVHPDADQLQQDSDVIRELERRDLYTIDKY